MNWADLVEHLEAVQVLAATQLELMVGISEHPPAQGLTGTPGQTSQRVMLLLPGGQQLDPPLRVVVRGSEMRILGTQSSPFMGGPSLVSCERVNADLPDEVSVVELTETGVLDVVTGLYSTVTTVIWSGPAHVVSGLPPTVDTGGEDAPLDKVTITLPVAAPYRDSLRVDVTTSRTPGLVGASFKLSGEVLDSAASLRRVVGYRLGV